ncbi:hypothetical protein GXN76_12665 [Kroppenstedtia pulmonis]|uniref:Uncharacterized protein n=1 Tax=Kroppenstedtia pulmonis TaxID=1380685 RepID=A0A7D3XRK1_9BACL|nr:hypothetical protein [Kroppenstedtia pulmonis]QKG85242.1 hypothetical protein GXN76_12665 [Kroppenstedtia pulmonis]
MLQKVMYRAPEGLLLAALTGLGYFSAYLSDIAYKKHFQIPSMYVEVHINSIILSVCIIIITLFMAYLSTVVEGLRRYGKFLFSFFIPGAIAVIVGMKLEFNIHWADWWQYLVLYLVHSGLLYCFFHYANRKNRLSMTISVSLLIFLIISVAIWCGHIIAKNQSHFLVSKTPSPVIVVDTYKDTLVIAPVNMKTGTVTPKYQFVHLESDLNEKMHFELKKVGPLTIRE